MTSSQAVKAQPGLVDDLVTKATALVKKVNLYFVALAAGVSGFLGLWELFGLKESYGIGGIAAISLALAVPFLIVFLTDTLPKLRAGRRERALVQVGDTSGEIEAGYFRLVPYGLEDQRAFVRADKAHEAVRQWIQESREPLLYLTGRSGTGKSSLLNAWVLPSLGQGESAFEVLSVRAFADPVATLKQAVLGSGLFGEAPPEKPDDPRALLAAICRRLGGKRLLIVLDQFEEFVTLHSRETRTSAEALLRDLIAEPIDGLTLLVVVRSDYIAALQDLDLPPLRDRENWFEVGPFSRAAATSFLAQSDLHLDAKLTSDVLDEAGEIEENPGLIRPITLNMLGIVLERFHGGALKGTAPGTLIRDYLKQAIGAPEVADHAPKVLGAMITSAGTKHPKSVGQLVEEAGLRKGVVRGCLVRLSRDGLVREIDRATETWEVSHDYVARLLSPMVARARPELLRRAGRTLGFVALGLWLAALLGAYPAYESWRYRQARAVFAEEGVLVARDDKGGHSLDFTDARAGAYNRLYERMDRLYPIAELRVVGQPEIEMLPLERLAGLQKLVISNNAALAELHGLERLAGLQTLVISGNEALVELHGLEGLADLRTLEISNNDALAELHGLERLASLQTLVISDNDALDELHGLEGLAGLQTLVISHNDALAKLRGLEGLTGLQALEISDNNALAELHGIGGLASLQSLQIFDNAALAELRGLEGLASLQTLQVSFNDALTELHGLGGLAGLQTLRISFNDSLAELRGFEGLASLQTLVISDNDALAELRGFEGLASLQSLEISDNDTLAELRGLEGLAGLQSLEISDNDALDELRGLEGLAGLRTLEVSGNDALDELRGLEGLTGLQALEISFNAALTELSGLEGLAGLQTLAIYNNAALAELRGLESLASLRTLAIYNNAALAELRGLEHVKRLRNLAFDGEFTSAITDALAIMPELIEIALPGIPKLRQAVSQANMVRGSNGMPKIDAKFVSPKTGGYHVMIESWIAGHEPITKPER